MSKLQEEDGERFWEIMVTGKALIQACEVGDIEAFHEKLTSIDFESRKMVFWHAS